MDPTPNELLQTSTSALSNKLIQRTRKLAADFSVNTEVSTTAIIVEKSKAEKLINTETNLYFSHLKSIMEPR